MPDPSPADPPPPLAEQIARLLDQFTRNRSGVRAVTALAVGWAWLTLVGLNAALTREAVEGTRVFSSYVPHEFRTFDLSLVARALGATVVGACLLMSWVVLVPLSTRAARMIHYLITDSFTYLSVPPTERPVVPGAANPETVRVEVSYLIEGAVSWFKWYVFGWLAVVAYNVLASVATAAVSAGVGGW